MIASTEPTDKISDKIIEKILRDPPQAAWDLFRFKCWGAKQEELIWSPFLHPLTECHSGHAVGKTEALGVIPLLWLFSHPYGYWIQTAATWKPIEHKIWPLVKKNYARAVVPLGGRLTESGLVLAPGWEIVLMSPTDPLVAHGWHSEGGTGIGVDEASDMDAVFYQHLRSSASGERDAMLLTLNPTQSDGPAADAIRSSTYHHIHMSALESPNVVEAREVVPGLCSLRYVKEIEEEFGIDSYEYTVRVLGELPNEAQLTVISHSMIRKAVERYNSLQSLEIVGDVIFSGDTALSTAGDFTVFGARDQVKTLLLGDKPVRRLRSDDYDLIEGEAKIAIGECPVEPRSINIDAGGQTALPSRLKNQGYPVLSCQAASEPHDKEHFVNQRAEMYWNFRKALLNGFAIHPDHGAILLKQAGIQRKPLSNGKIQIEPKEDFMERALSGKSPDEMDQLALTFVERPGEVALKHTSKTARLKYRPILKHDPDLERGWLLGFDGVPEYFGAQATYQPGQLMRSWWFGPVSACVWVHMDNNGAWVVFDALVSEPIDTMADFARRAVDISRQGRAWHNYMIDVAASEADESSIIGIGDEMARHILKRYPDNPRVLIPSWMPREKLRSDSGVQMLDKLTAGAADGRGQGLYVWPDSVAAALDGAWSEPGRGEAAGNITGGPIIKALRVLAIEWSPMIGQAIL